MPVKLCVESVQKFPSNAVYRLATIRSIRSTAIVYENSQKATNKTTLVLFLKTNFFNDLSLNFRPPVINNHCTIRTSAAIRITPSTALILNKLFLHFSELGWDWGLPLSRLTFFSFFFFFFGEGGLECSLHMR